MVAKRGPRIRRITVSELGNSVEGVEGVEEKKRGEVASQIYIASTMAEGAKGDQSLVTDDKMSCSSC